MAEITELSSFKYLVEERKLDPSKLTELANSGKITFQENEIQIPMKDFD
jgi:hypothetical protein